MLHIELVWNFIIYINDQELYVSSVCLFFVGYFDYIWP